MNRPVPLLQIEYSRAQLEGMRTPSEWAVYVVAPLPPYGKKAVGSQGQRTVEILEWACDPQSLANAAIGPRVSRYRIDDLIDRGLLVWRGSDAEKEAIRLHETPPSPAPVEARTASQEALV